ncbi:LacI family DNA-binding transcriptional regulator [Microbacterium murale]|uniref:LacI family transcriptional regulator n=1 Tax=Microbacterium murale TaxID=1081040 RepID=A0ABU0PBZ1_9MICO|nr:LacI family DNA-binding transcriptional regulator [Microbacterium murale]MDQ0644186.1 LacI family transcriptional regulator [Microbacterium murale]
MSAPTNRANPTIHAVARAAGVSSGTVSNALNHPARLAPETLERVHDAIIDLGYIRSAAGRTLIRNRSDSLGLVMPDLVNVLFVEIARGAQRSASDQGKRLVTANSGFNAHELAAGASQVDDQDEYLEYFAEARADGVLVASMRDPSRGIDRIRNHVRPVVVINYDVPNADWCTVLMDNEQVGRAAIEHIADLGIRRAYFVSIPDIVQPIAERRRGVRAAAAARGIHLTEIETAGLFPEDSTAALAGVLPEPGGERLAILGANDRLAIGALQLLRNRPDLRVPEDVAVLGMDGDHRDDGADWITLTSVVLPGQAMGAEAIRLIDAEAQPGHVHERSVLPVRIRQGASTIGR